MDNYVFVQGAWIIDPPKETSLLFSGIQNMPVVFLQLLFNMVIWSSWMNSLDIIYTHVEEIELETLIVPKFSHSNFPFFSRTYEYDVHIDISETNDSNPISFHVSLVLTELNLIRLYKREPI